MSGSLTPAVKKIIADSAFSPHEKSIVKRCVLRYSTPHTFSQVLWYVAYRILNAVRSLFQKSDRQLAEKIFFRTIIPYKTELFAYPQRNERVNQLLNYMIAKTKRLLATTLLKELIFLNERITTKKQIARIVEKKLERCDKEFQTKLDKIIKELPEKYKSLKNITMRKIFP